MTGKISQLQYLEMSAPWRPFSSLAPWSFGQVLYFVFSPRYNKNRAAEEEVRDYNNRMQPVWDAEKAMKAAKANRKELLYLAKETGTPVKNYYSNFTYLRMHIARCSWLLILLHFRFPPTSKGLRVIPAVVRSVQ